MTRHDSPYTNFTYEVRIDDDTVGGFTRISGLGAESNVLEYREGGLHEVTHTFPSDVTYSNVTLHRGVTDDDGFLEWIMESMSGARADVRSKVSVAMKDREDRTRWTWVLLNAYPVRWDGPELVANARSKREGTGLSIERLELAYESLDARTS